MICGLGSIVEGGMSIILCSVVAFGTAQDDYALERELMVKTQLESRGILHSKTLNAMRKVPRHLFVPENLRSDAYTDGPLPIGDGQTISQPYIVGYMTQELQLKPSDRVLEIGTGSGYQAAILAQIVDSVYTIEIVNSLARTAKERLRQLGYNNVIVKQGDGYEGWPAKAPFDAIMVTAGAATIPQPLVDQLKEGGRMIIPVGPQHAVSHLVLLKKTNYEVTRKKLIPVRFVPFTREKKPD